MWTAPRDRGREHLCCQRGGRTLKQTKNSEATHIIVTQVNENEKHAEVSEEEENKEMRVGTNFTSEL